MTPDQGAVQSYQAAAAGMTAADDRTRRSVRLDIARPFAAVIAQIRAGAPYPDDKTWKSLAGEGRRTSRQRQLCMLTGPSGLITLFALETGRSALFLIGFPLIDLSVITDDKRRAAEIGVAMTAVETAASATSITYDLPSALLGWGDDTLVRLGVDLDEKFALLLGASPTRQDVNEATVLAEPEPRGGAGRSIRPTPDDGIVLVCGAGGGKQGSTGAHLVRVLSQQGATVRALVHRDDESAASLRAAGIATIAVDLLDPDEVERALEGVSRAYFNFPVRSGFVQAAEMFAEAAARNTVERVVSLSHLNAGPNALSPRSREHADVETLFDQAGIGAIHLRAAVFFENVRRQTAATVAASDKVRLPLGKPTTNLPLIGAVDVARVAAGLLMAPEPPGREPVIAIGEVQTAVGLATVLARALGRQVTYAPSGDDDWRLDAMAREGPDGAVQVEHLSAVWETMRVVAEHVQKRFEATPDTFISWSGQPAQSLFDFTTTNAQWFSQ